MLDTQETLEHPDERQLRRGISSTDVPEKLGLMVNALIGESARAEQGYVLVDVATVQEYSDWPPSERLETAWSTC